MIDVRRRRQAACDYAARTMSRVHERTRRWPHVITTVGVLATLVLAAPGVAASVSSAEVAIVRDVPYGAGELLLDVYPAADPIAPVVMVIHGGGWTNGDKRQVEPESRALAALGFMVVAVNYSLDPALGPAYQRQVGELQTALAWVQDHADEYGGDPARIGVLGGSAGGYLASMLGTQANTAEAQPVRAVVSLSGPTDIAALVRAQAEAQRPSSTCTRAPCPPDEIGPGGLAALLGCEPDTCSPDVLRQASPISHVTPHSASFFLAHSDDELIPEEQAIAMAEALRAEGVATELQIVPGRGHSFEILPAIATQVQSFLQLRLGDRPTDPTIPGAEQPGGPGARDVRWELLAAGGLVLLAAIFIVRRVRRVRQDQE